MTRQVGEAVGWLVPGVENDMIFTDAALAGEAIGRGFVVHTLIPASDLDKVCREREEAVRLLRAMTSAGAMVFNRIHTGLYTRGQVQDWLRKPIDQSQAFLNKLDDRDGGGPG